MPDPSALTLITLQAAALFRFDGVGRITGANEPDPDRGPGPRLFLGRTPEGNIWRFGRNVSNDLAAKLDEILADEPVGDELERPAGCFDTLVRTLETASPVTSVWSGPAWLVPVAVPPQHGTATTSALDPSLLPGSLPTFASDLAPTLPYAAVVVDGRVASVCSCSRITDTVAEAGVHTIPTHRGRGYAPAVVAVWAVAVRESGRLPLYSTSWDNTASRRVAAKLGLILYGTDLSIG